MSKRERIPQADVLAWLHEHHPELHQHAEIERDWVWLCVDLRGDNNKATRESIKEYGFRFAKRGHPFPDGRTGTWAHSCERPTGCRSKGGQTASTQPQSGAETESDEALIAAMIA